MKKIKITEKQAKLLETLNSKKVLKVTKEQYNRIIESELYRPSLTETPELHEEEINEELFREFINELYGMNEEGAECKYDKLNKVMEAAGLIEGGKLVKEKFGKDPKRVKEVVGKGLMKLKECGSVYEAVELMESMTNSDIKQSFSDQIHGEPSKNYAPDNVKNTYTPSTSKPKDDTTNKPEDKPEDKPEYRQLELPLDEEMGLDKREHLGANQIKLNDLTFEKVKEFFPNFYQKPKEYHGTKDMSDDYYSYFDYISFPNPDDSLTAIENRGVFERWKNETLSKYGEDVTLEFNPDEVWSRRVRIINNPSFDNDERRAVDVKKSDLDSWRKKGNFGLDETDSFSSGSFEGPMNQKPAFKSNVSTELEEAVNLKDVIINIPDEAYLRLIKRTPTFRNYFSNKQLENLHVGDNKLTVNHTVYGKMKTQYPEGATPFGLKNESEITDKIYEALKKKVVTETDLTNVGDYQYATPGFEDIDMKGNHETGKGKTFKKPAIKGGKFVKVKDKCKTFPYCNQGPEAIEIKNKP